MKLSDLFHQHKDLARILQKSDRVDVNNARNSGGPQGYVRIYSVKRLKNGGFLFVTITREPYKRPRKHLVKIWPKDPNYRGKLSDCPDVLIRCDCARFMFKWEVANNIHGISPIHYSNGEFPSETNPRAKASGCKHVIRCGKAILNHGW